jgi:hypothetical protein
MIKEIEISVLPENYSDNSLIKKLISKELRISVENINSFTILRKSIDARKHPVVFRLRIRVFTHETIKKKEKKIYDYKFVKNKPPIIIVGSGPAGLFAALHLLTKGLKPILIERGKKVEERKHDIANIHKNHFINENSNYCFGEGGAGTYSDGKLYTRSNKRGNVDDVINQLVIHGANPEILIDAHPHIGTDKLPAIISNIRNTILQHGGEFYFDSKITDFIIKNNKISSIIDHKGNNYEGIAYILATGHSAKDIYELLYNKGLYIEPKPFALGVRVEHPQSLIDEIQYHQKKRSEFLPAATYQLVTQVENRGVFSFCMCPGGIIVPASTENNSIVVNGMSNSRRNSVFANSGIVVTVNPNDFSNFDSYGPLAGLAFQESIEKRAFQFINKGQKAPAQRLTDFVNNTLSQNLNKTSYNPGIEAVNLNEILPEFLASSLRRAFVDFNGKMKGFLTEQANVVGFETRTSSPVRIPRIQSTLNHAEVENLYPCGEGAGYAGGIVSSALDGIAVAEMISNRINIS